MKKKVDYNEIIHRIGRYRNENDLSARETSLRLGFSDSFINRIERKTVELKVSTLLEFLELVNVDLQEFVYENPENYKEDKEILDMINNLSKEDKQFVKDFIYKLKK